MSSKQSPASTRKRHPGRLHRPFVVRYVAGLTLLAVVSVLGHAGLAVLEHERLTAVTRQSLATQAKVETDAVIGAALLTSQVTPAQRVGVSVKLSSFLDDLASSEAMLRQSFPGAELRGVTAAERAAYVGPKGIDAQLTTFIADGRIVVRPESTFTQRDDATRELFGISGPLSTALTSAAQKFKSDAAARSKESMVADPAILILTLIIIIAEGPLIFAPMSRRIRTEVRRLATAEAHQRFEADHDSLTGLVNRRYLSGLVTSYEADGIDYVMLLSDVDHFKTINDTLGHDVGDQVLLAYAAVLNRTASGVPARELPANSSLAGQSTSVVAGRLGGDEFLVVMPMAGLGEAAAVFAEAQRALPAELAGQGLPRVTTSWGVSAGGPGQAWSVALKTADNALYLAKERGRNCLATERDLAETTCT